MQAVLAIAVWAPLQACMAQTGLSDTAMLAATCATCHGPDGRPPSPGGSIPALRGPSAPHLLQRLQAMQKHNDPRATVMPQLLQGLSDAQLQALAQWFSEAEPR